MVFASSKVPEFEGVSAESESYRLHFLRCEIRLSRRESIGNLRRYLRCGLRKAKQGIALSVYKFVGVYRSSELTSEQSESWNLILRGSVGCMENGTFVQRIGYFGALALAAGGAVVFCLGLTLSPGQPYCV